MALNLAVLLNESAQQYPDRTAIIMGSTRLTYRELNAAANKVTNALRSLGVQRGDRIAVMLPNVPQFAMVYYGILKLGATVVPLNALLSAAAARLHLDDCGAVALFAWEESAEAALHAVQVAKSCRHLIIVNTPGSSYLPDGAIALEAMLAIGASTVHTSSTMPDDTAAIIYTTGEGDLPPGVQLTHINLLLNTAILNDRLLHLTPDDVGLAAMPLSDPFGQTCAMNLLLYAGGALSLAPRLDAHSLWQAIERDRVTCLIAAPVLFGQMVDLSGAGPRPALRTCLCAGAPVPTEAQDAFLACFGIPILELYGMAETSPVVTLNPRPGLRPGSAGLPLWGVDVKIVGADQAPLPPGETGEIIVSGHNVMKGYTGHSEATNHALRNGWLYTGDLGYMDSDGYVYVTGRVTGRRYGFVRGATPATEPLR